MTKQILLLTAMLLLSLGLRAQSPSVTYIDINDIKAGHLPNGTLWNDSNYTNASCEYPKGSRKHVLFSGNLWLAGTTGSGLHTAAGLPGLQALQTDYQPGPIDTAGTMTAAHNRKWARIWKLNKTTIDSFRSVSAHTTANTPADILQWPALGNPYAAGASGAPLTILRDLAPFVDVNGDGRYNALNGDYPSIRGDQMLWWVFNDNGGNRTATSDSDPLGAEVRVSAYAYKDSLLKSVVYYSYEIVNRGTGLSGFTAGLFADGDLGYSFDDYIGFDSSHRMGITYNGKSRDGNGQPYSYGTNIPMVGVSLLQTEGDGPNTRVPAGSFNYFNNDTSEAGNPTVKEHFYNAINAKTTRGGHSLTRDYTGPGVQSRGYGGGPQTRYVFDGDPGISSEWSECASANTLGDRRMIIASRPLPTVFPTDGVLHLTYALIVKPGTGGCPTTGFGPIKGYADTVWQQHQQRNGIREVAGMPAATAQVYPNPARRDLHVVLPQAATATLVLTDLSGRRVLQDKTTSAGRADLDLSPLSPGIYLLHIAPENGVAETRKVVVQ